MTSYASPVDVEVIVENYGWNRDESRDEEYEGEWCVEPRVYISEQHPTWVLVVANLGRDDAYAAVENADGIQFADCDLVAEYDYEELDYLESMLGAIERGVYDRFE